MQALRSIILLIALIAVATDVAVDVDAPRFELDRPDELAAFLEKTLIRRRPSASVPQ
jgi:hypothetical protein